MVLEDRVVEADLVLEGERIAAIEPRGSHPAAGDEVIDASGKVVLPGGVDPHVHVWEPGAPELEGFEAASQGAAAGGITTFIEMPLSQPPTVDVESFALKRRLAEASCVVDFALWGGLLPGKLGNVASLREAGAVGFKAFMNKPRIDYYTNLPDGLLLEAMRQVKAAGSLIAVHCENEEILAYNREMLLAASRRDYLSHSDWKPVVAELDAIQRVLLFAGEVGVPVHVVHLSTARGAEMIAQAKARGQAVTVETCPHYLLLDLDDLARL
ncbi:MAG TPA: amidohydrolase family protein, partial [bacterium]|nr:amidohydrolase family protein [bacterium]